MRNAWVVGVAASASLACNNADDQRGKVCTDLFASIAVSVVDSVSSPVPGLSIRDSVLRIGVTFTLTNNGILPEPGRYVVFDDSHLQDVRESGDPVQVTGTSMLAGPGAQPGFTQLFVFGSDGCHVRKVSGPDTVVAR